MNEDMKLSKRQVQFLSGLFVSRANCLGFDRNTPVGEVANHARIHWDYIERKQFKTDNRIKTLKQSNDILIQNVRYLESKIKEMGERQNRRDNWNKYKRCVAMAWGCLQRMELFHELVLEEARTIALPNEALMQQNRRKRERAAKWHKRWLKLADYYKGHIK